MKHFTIKELCHSDKACQLGIENDPTPTACDNLIALTDAILDPAREALKKPIHVNSGYRCRNINKIIKGAEKSQHMKGEAVDIELGGRTPIENEELYNWIVKNCEFDQLINEYDFSWIHVSYCKNNNRNQTLKTG